MSMRQVDQIFSDSCPLVRTRDQLSRALDRAVHQSYGAGTALRNAVVASTRELRTQGMSDPEALSVLGTLAEDVGRTSGGNRLDLVSGRPRWMLTRERVLKWATLELGRAQPR